MVAMSGGVDSGVAACLLKQQGFDCTGVTMKLFNEESGQDGPSCCTSKDIEDAKSVAAALGIEHHVFNFTDRFRECVIERFVRAYENGATPNPCVDCNRWLKFSRLFQSAKELGFDAVATGHYARVEYDAALGRYLLKKAVCAEKDQSYVLYSLTQQQLSHVLFPLGGMRKTQVREIASEHSFINADKRDSQDICFVKDGRYADFIREYTGRDYPHGNFVDKDGNVLGEHKGIIRYTVGQRKGLGLSLQAPMYVCKVDKESNTVLLGSNDDLFTRSLTAEDVNLIAAEKLTSPVRLKAKVRYRQPEQWATVEQTGEHTLHIEFDEPQRAITKGQSAVLYDGDVVVGGGVIC